MRDLLKRLRLLALALVRIARRRARLVFNRLGKKRQCYVCGKRFNHFTKYGEGRKKIPEFRLKLMIVGSDVDNFGCMYCGSHDRERHLYMFFDKLRLWDAVRASRVLHFAPEKHLRSRITGLGPAKYTAADLFPRDEQTERIDVTDLPFDDESYDFVVCNHVLEHVKEYRTALSEIYRVLSPNGLAVLQTPVSRLLTRNFEDDGIDSDTLRLYFYGERAHCRVFSEKHLFEDMMHTGFRLDVAKNGYYFTDSECRYYGVNGEEDLILLRKGKATPAAGSALTT